MLFGVLTLILGPGMLWAQADAPPSYQAYRLAEAPRIYHDSGQVASVVMGRRNVQTTTNTLSGSYNFNALMGMTLRVRHYWSKVAYDSAFHLTPDGYLHPTDYPLWAKDGTTRHDRNFNAFNVDLVYNWQFAPGSMLTFVWKNAIYTDEPDTNPTFTENLSSVLLAPQLNSLSLRLLYSSARSNL